MPVPMRDERPDPNDREASFQLAAEVSVTV
jgi:hypothetical protein